MTVVCRRQVRRACVPVVRAKARTRRVESSRVGRRRRAQSTTVTMNGFFTRTAWSMGSAQCRRPTITISPKLASFYFTTTHVTRPRIPRACAKTDECFVSRDLTRRFISRFLKTDKTISRRLGGRARWERPSQRYGSPTPAWKRVIESIPSNLIVYGILGINGAVYVIWKYAEDRLVRLFDFYVSETV